MTEKKVNIYAIDAMRAVAIFAVVLIHTTSRTLEFFQYDLNGHLITLFLNQISRFAVPLFFLISGFVLELNHHANINYWAYFKKRASRIVIPYLFWSAIYYLLIYRSDPDNFIKAILTGSASYQLYFIPALIIFYLAFPLLHKIYTFIANKWILITLGIIQVAILYQDYSVHHVSINFPTAVALFNFYVFFLGMVAAVNNQKLLPLFGRYKYYLVGAVLLLACYIFWQGRSFYYQTYNIGAFYSQWRPSVLFYTLVLAAIGFYFFEKTHFAESFFKVASKLSFFIFFAHVAILEEVWKIYRLGWSGWWDIPFFLAVSLIAFLVALLVHKIPHVSKITG